jgi:hypothetical protein
MSPVVIVICNSESYGSTYLGGYILDGIILMAPITSIHEVGYWILGLGGIVNFESWYP